MNATNRVLKFQMTTFFKNLVIAVLVGILVALSANIFVGIISDKALVFNGIIGSALFTSAMVVIIFLIVQCFGCFFEDFRFSNRLGITRRNFFKGNLIFFLIVILIYSLVISGIIFGFSKDSSFLVDIVEDIVLEIEFEDEAEDMNPEEVNQIIQEKVDKIKNSNYFDIFKIIFNILLGITGFWLFIGFLIFALGAKALIIIVPFVAIWSILTSIPYMASFPGSIIIFIISQLLIYFGLQKIDSAA